jgi:DNA polymerase-4
MQKPDGLVVIEEGDLPQCLFRLELEELSGIGRKMKPRLNREGIHTVKDLCTADKALLRNVWGGIEGERMYAKLRGEMVYDHPTRKSSVGHSHVLPPSLRTDENAFAVLNRLLQKAAMRLRSYGCTAAAMNIGIRYLNGARWRDELSFDNTQDTVQLLSALTKLWKRKPAIEFTPLKVGVTLLKLSEQQNITLPLFNLTRSSPEFNAALDKLNLRYGKNTIYFGGAHSALESAPMRIAFNHVPDLEVEGDE